MPGVGLIYVSRTGLAHLPGCPHLHNKGREWGIIDERGAWDAIGRGLQVQATGGRLAGRIAKSRCATCAKPFLNQEV